MRWVALTTLTRMTPVSDGQRVEVPLSGGRTFKVDDADARELASDDSQPMTFERALLFAKVRGRRIVRKSWDVLALGNLQVVEGHLRWSLDDGMTVILASEDLLAGDWIVLP